MTNVNTTVIPLNLGGNADGYKIGWFVSADKAAKNDTITVTNVKNIISAKLFDATGEAEPYSIEGNVVTCTGEGTTLKISGIILYKEF